MLGHFSCAQLCDLIDCSLPGSSAHGILQQEYWSGLPGPPLGDLPDTGIERAYAAVFALLVDSLLLGPWGSLRVDF